MKSLLERNRLEEQIIFQSGGAALPPDLAGLLAQYRQCVEPFSLRQAQYSTQLVLLYGAFEKLIEGLLAGVTDSLSDLVPQFDLLPSRIQENHRRKSLDALRDEIWLSRQTDPQLASRLIENLNSCENRLSNYALNSLAYTRHGGNFRKFHIDEAFRDLAIEDLCSRVASGDFFQKYLDAAPRTGGMLDRSLGAIDDLAERRNEIAHGSPSQLLSLDELSAYLEFFRTFARGAYITLCHHMAQFVVGHHAQKLGTIHKVHYRHVVCLDTGVLPEGTWIEVGDLVALRLSDREGFELGEIIKLKIETGDQQRLRTQQGLETCIETNLHLREGKDLYLVTGDNQTANALARPLSN